MSVLGVISAAMCAFAILYGPAMAQHTTKLRGLNTENEAMAWQAIGRLDHRDGYCTATLIAPDLLLTAAHCVYDGKGAAISPADLSFQAGLTHGKAAARRKVYDPHVGVNAKNVRHDVALVRLAKPIPTHELAPFSVFDGRVPDGPVSVVSYGRGRSDALSRQNACQVVQHREQIVTMDCDVTFGSSGSPVFTHLNGRGQIASVISSIGKRGGRQVAFGMELPKVVSVLKRQMRANKPQPKAQVRRLGIGGNKGSTGAKFVTAKGS
jgi:protease YdgD